MEIMVNRRVPHGSTWLHARVGRRVAADRRGQSAPRTTNARTSVRPSAAALRPTVHLSSQNRLEQHS